MGLRKSHSGFARTLACFPECAAARNCALPQIDDARTRSHSLLRAQCESNARTDITLRRDNPEYFGWFSSKFKVTELDRYKRLDLR